MDLLTREELKALITETGAFCASIYLPTHRAGIEAHQQDPVRLKNLLRQVEDEVKEFGLRGTELKPVLQPAWDLVDDNHFWARQEDGLALFIAPERFRYYRVPIPFQELVVTGFNFHIKPLLPVVSGDAVFYVLALSQNENRLLRCTQFQQQRVELPAAPKDMREALRFDDPERQLQWHTGTTQRPSGERGAQFHGHSTGGNDERIEKENVTRYFREIDEAVSAHLSGQNAPLVIAAVTYEHALYREANSYPHLAEQRLEMNPDRVEDGELRLKAAEMLESVFNEHRHQETQRYQELMGKGAELASNDLGEICSAAYSAKIETLFVPTQQHKWGQFDASTLQCHVHDERQEGDEDLLNFCAAQTFLNGGNVFTGQHLPDPVIAAIYRY